MRQLQREERRQQDNGRKQITGAEDSAINRVLQPSPRAAAFAGAAVAGVAASVFSVLLRKRRRDGNTISGDVAVHLLNRVELLTIRLQVRHARRGGPAEIDVHRAKDDAWSR
jgi:hypothetical protein